MITIVHTLVTAPVAKKFWDYKKYTNILIIYIYIYTYIYINTTNIVSLFLTYQYQVHRHRCIGFESYIPQIYTTLFHWHQSQQLHDQLEGETKVLKFATLSKLNLMKQIQEFNLLLSS